MHRLITIAIHKHPFEAEAESLLLEQEGLQSFLAAESLTAPQGVKPNDSGSTRLQVAESDAPQAMEILERHRGGASERSRDGAETKITFACEECGNDIVFSAERGGHVEICPECGEYVDVPIHSTSRRSRSLPMTGGNGTLKESSPGSATSGRLWFEVLAVLCLAVFPDLFNAVAAMAGWTPRSYPFVQQGSWIIVRAVQVSIPLLLILRLNNEPLAQFGIVRFSWLLDIPLGGLVWMLDLMIWDWVVSRVPGSWQTGAMGEGFVDWTKPEGVLGYLLLLATSLANGFAEEFVMRGYLLPRVERLFHSTWLAILVTSILFASYHVYQGTFGLIGAAATGVVYGGFFCLTRRLWPVCVAHALADFVGLL